MEHINKILTDIKEEGLFKKERTITTPQSVEIRTQNGNRVLNFCATGDPPVPGPTPNNKKERLYIPLDDILYQKST